MGRGIEVLREGLRSPTRVPYGPSVRNIRRATAEPDKRPEWITRRIGDENTPTRGENHAPSGGLHQWEMSCERERSAERVEERIDIAFCDLVSSVVVRMPTRLRCFCKKCDES